MPGWDCHGLPIELKALQQQQQQQQRELRHQNSDGPPGPLKVRKMAKKLALATVEEQKTGFKEWAVMGDWDNAWKTMDPEFELRQLKVFKTMVERGLIYRKFKPVYWSPSTGTALAEAELEYNPDHISTAAFVKLPLRTIPEQLSKYRLSEEEPVHAVIWTITPWTLLANRAIAVHSALKYSLVRSHSHGLLLFGRSRLSAISQATSEDGALDVLETVPGSQLVGFTYQMPAAAGKKTLPIVHANFVDPESGSGLVHMAPGHGMDDYKLCQEHDIEPFAPVDDQGCFTSEAFPSDPELFQGQEVLGSGNELVIRTLKQEGLLLGTHKYVHKYPYDWRSKRPVIIRATQQWFADTDAIRQSAIRALERVRFVPDGGRDRLASFLRNHSEWCISRQRAWGVPIPAIFRRSDGCAILTPESIEHVMSVIQNRGTDAWWSDAESESAWIPPSLGDASEYVRGMDTMDVWFDSGTAWTELEKGAPLDSQCQADVYLEGSDQHRGWFQSSLLTKVASQSITGIDAIPVAPFKTLVTHGFTLDERGRKMSKSEGNVMAPSQIMDATYHGPAKKKKGQGAPKEGTGAGPDALRLWVGSCDFTKDVVIGDNIVQNIVQSLSKLRNTLKFLLGSLAEYQPFPVKFSSLDSIDRMALMQLRDFNSHAQNAYQNFEYHRVVSGLNQYVNTDLSSTYFRYIKDRLYVDAAQSPSRLQAQAVLWEILQGLLRVISPVLPLLVEEVCHHLPGQLCFHPVRSQDDDRMSMILGAWDDPVLQRDIQYLAMVKTQAETAMETARAEKGVGSSLQFHVAIEILGPRWEKPGPMFEALTRRLHDLDDFLVVSQTELYKAPSRPASMEIAPWKYSKPCMMGDEEVVIHVYEASLGKCERCWKYTVPKETDLEEPLCLRCLGVLEGLREEHAGIFDGKLKIDEAAGRCRDLPGMEKHWG